MQDRRRVPRRDSRIILMVRVFVLLLAGVSDTAVHPSHAQEAEVITLGRVYYQQYCAGCHGATAKGDGPLASQLKVTPADLTQISKKNKGEFPQWRVFHVIDGREEVKGHGTREMPIWGPQFKIEIQEERAQTRAFRAAGRILVLVEYLRSLQAP